MNVFLGELWDHHPCCVVAMQEDFIQKHPEAAQEFVSLLVETGEYIENDKARAAQIAVNFLDPEGKMGLNPATKCKSDAWCCRVLFSKSNILVCSMFILGLL